MLIHVNHPRSRESRPTDADHATLHTMEVEYKYRPAHSCKHCQRIVLCRKNFMVDSCRIKLPHSGSEIRQAVEDGCKLFQLFFFRGRELCQGRSALENIVRHTLWKNYRNPGTFRWRLKRLILLIRARLWVGSFYLAIHNLQPQETLHQTPPPVPPFGFALDLEYDHVSNPCPLAGLKAAPGVAAHELCDVISVAQNPSVGSTDSLLQALKWLNTCHDTHVSCPRAADNFVPTRLLDLAPDNQSGFVRLVAAIQKPDIKWAALSYVWGGDHSSKTTSSSLATMHKKVPVAALPRTLQDAVLVSVALGLTYLWIDSICIVQDDDEDLARELAIMPLIYQQAWVTISASTASTVSTGFLHDRGYWTLDSRAGIVLPYRSENGIVAGNIVIGEGYIHEDEKKRLPIDDRAWTYQERMLSPRLLDFNDSNLTFICRTGKFCEGQGSMSWPSQVARPWSKEQHRIPCIVDQDLPTWHTIVRDYMTRKLTFSQDKLRAIAALAELYKSRTKHTYVAGLWKETLIFDLCWIITNGRKSLPEPKCGITSASRPPDYRAPSWSWAALDLTENSTLSFVHYVPTTSVYGGDECEEIFKAQPDAVLLDIVLQQSPPDTTYGKLYGGCVKLEGLTSTTKWFYYNGQLATKARCQTWLDASQRGWVNNPSSYATVTALILTRGTGLWFTKYDLVFGLLLMETSEETYRRVGAFELTVGIPLIPDYVYNVDEEFERRTITIV